MPIKFDILRKSEIRSSESFTVVSALADKFREFLNDSKIEDEIKVFHRHGGTSTQIQTTVLPGVKALGFTSEKKGLFKNYEVPRLRPDYYAKVGDSGVLLEVERGKTIANNMDILDLWKCHICNHADYLFMLVPKFRQTKKGTQTPIYEHVKNRLGTFFIQKNHVNVDGVFLFGY
jgi:hypothetical protein